MLSRIVSAGVAVFVFLEASSAAEINGPVKVVDADTIYVGEQIIRLLGIDALEKDQNCEIAGAFWQCGKETAEVLRQWTLNQQIRCVGDTSDRYGRLLAECFLGSVSLNEQLVFQGLAMAYVEYSTKFVEAEASAREFKRGIWAGEFVEPWNYRKQSERNEQDAVLAFSAVAWAIREQVRAEWNQPPGDFKGMSVSFNIRVDRDGNVTSVAMSRSSGNWRLDESAENAIYKASPLAIPTEARFYEYIKEFEFVFSPLG